MDNALCLRALLTVSINVGHHIVAHQTLTLLCHLVVDILSVSL